MDQNDDPRCEAALWGARRAPAGRRAALSPTASRIFQDDDLHERVMMTHDSADA